MILDKSVYARRKPKAVNFDTRISIRVNKEMLDSFTEFYGDKWINKVRSLMEESLKKDKAIQEMEDNKRKGYLNTNKYNI